jgi:hypothetical protein
MSIPARSFAVRSRIVQDATTSLPQTLKSLDHLVGVATARFQVQAEAIRGVAIDLVGLKAQLEEFALRTEGLGPRNRSFLMRTAAILKELESRLQGAAA